MAKENVDLHVWVERETHRAAEQQMQIVTVQMLNRKLTTELEQAQVELLRRDVQKSVKNVKF